MNGKNKSEIIGARKECAKKEPTETSVTINPVFIQKLFYCSIDDAKEISQKVARRAECVLNSCSQLDPSGRIKKELLLIYLDSIGYRIS